MKTSIILATTAAIALAGTAVFADGKDHGKDHGERRGGKMFQRMDINDDGRITLAEATTFRDQRFSRMDTDGNGAVTLAEIEDAGRKRRKDRAAKRFERMDSNGDGSITRAEFDAMADARFAKMDANDDGAITREEIKAGKRRRGG